MADDISKREEGGDDGYNDGDHPGRSTQGFAPQKTYTNISADGHARVHAGNEYNIFTTPGLDSHRSEQGETQHALESLAFDQMDFRFATIEPAFPGTCQWFLDCEEYRRWQDPSLVSGHSGILWIKGKPGVGKSVLMKYAFDQAEKSHEENETNISFFFNARGHDLEKSTEGMYRSLLYQLMTKLPKLQSLLATPKRALPRHGQEWPIGLLKDVFWDLSLSLGPYRLCCYIDALDECSEGEIRDMVLTFSSLCYSSAANGISFHVCFASRHYPRISVPRSEEIFLEDVENHNKDISTYIWKKLKIKNEKLKQQIAEEVLTRSSGIFLWVVLVVRLLNEECDRGRDHLVESYLSEMPDGFETLSEYIQQTRGLSASSVVGSQDTSSALPTHPPGSHSSVDTADDDRSSLRSTTNIMSEPTHDSTLPTSIGETLSARGRGDDRGSVYSIDFDPGLTSDQKNALVRQFAYHLISGLGSQDKDQLTMLLEAMPRVTELLKMFARVRSCQAQEIGELRATMFIRALRFRIKGFLNQELTKVLPAESAEIDSDQDSSDLRTPMNNFQDKIERWDYDTNHTDWQEQVDDEGCEPAVPAALLPESLAEFESHKAFLLESAEYRWLQWQLKALMALERGIDTMSGVRNTLLDAMPDVLRVAQAVDVELHLTLPWNPARFLQEQFPTATKLPSLSSVIAICGSPSNPYATTCGEYILQTWPTYGERALLIVENHIDQDLRGDESGSTGTTQSKFCLLGTYLEAIETAEVLIWLAVACRSTSSEFIESCVPRVLRDEQENSQEIAFSVHCDMDSLDVDQEAGCWRDMFRNPVLALGYPVPLRSHDEAGLEMSASMLAAVGRVPWVTVFDGGLVLKGFNTMAVAVKRIGDSILWHFMARKDGDRIAYHERNCMAGLSSLEEAFFAGARHFVAWTVAADLLVGRWLAGDDYSNYENIERSQSDLVHAGVRVDPAISISGGKYFPASFRFSLGTKDTPSYLSTYTYEACIDRARCWNVIFSDTTTRVHWLADGASTILHFCKAYLSPSRYPRRGSDDILRRIREAESNDSHGPRWAYETLVKMEVRQICLDVSNVEFKGKMTNKLSLTNQLQQEASIVGQFSSSTKLTTANQLQNEAAIEGTSSFNTFQGLAEKYFRYLEQLYDRVCKMRECKDIYPTNLIQRSEFVGFNFMDVLEGDRAVFPRRLKLEKPAQAWLALATQLDSINLLGADFGALIKHKETGEPNQQQCGMRSALIEKRDYLVAPMSVLRNAARRGRRHTRDSVQLTETRHWHNARTSFAGCQCGYQTPSSRCRSIVHALHDQPAKPAKDEAPIPREHPIFEEYETGAIIFGHEQHVLTKLPSGSPQTSLAAVPSDSGYGSPQTETSTPSPPNSSNAVHRAQKRPRRAGFLAEWWKNRFGDRTR